MDRRTVVKVLLEAGSLVAARAWLPPTLAQAQPATTPTAKPSRSVGRPYTVASWGGQYQKGFESAFVTPILQKHGLELRSDTIDYAKLQIQVQSKKVEWDIADVQEWFGYAGATKDLLEPIDYGIVDKAALPRGGAQTHAVQNAFLGRPLAYNTKVYSAQKHPRNWQEFWDAKAFPGKRGFWASPHSGILEAALLADGVAANKLFPLDLERAFKSLDRLKPHLVPARSGQALFQLFVDQQVDLALALEGRLNDALDAGASWAAVWEHAFVQREFLVVPKGTPYRELTMEIIAFALTPAAQARYTELTGYGPAIKGAFDVLDRKYLQRFAYSPTHDADKLIEQDGKWYAANIDQVNQRWQQWLAA